MGIGKLFLLVFLLGLYSCKQPNPPAGTNPAPQTAAADSLRNRTLQTGALVLQPAEPIAYNDTALVNIKALSNSFILDMRYASTDNFLKQQVYDCAECLLRYEAALALLRAQDSLMRLGYSLALFDCYRPFSVQQQMWAVMPDARYVANPHKKGSIHNRGGAVDLTLAKGGAELDMGSPFDHFGPESAHAYLPLADSIIARRQLLKSVMEHCGFQAQAGEWWHYSYSKAGKYSKLNMPLPCK